MPTLGSWGEVGAGRTGQKGGGRVARALARVTPTTEARVAGHHSRCWLIALTNHLVVPWVVEVSGAWRGERLLGVSSS